MLSNFLPKVVFADRDIFAIKSNVWLCIVFRTNVHKISTTHLSKESNTQPYMDDKRALMQLISALKAQRTLN